MSTAARRSSGFSLLELIVVILIIGVLASVAAPRLLRDDSYTPAGYAEQVMALMRYAQQVAVAERREICVAYNATPPARFELRRTVNFATPGSACNAASLVMLASSDPYVATVPNGVTAAVLPATGLRFNALGQASPAASVTVTVPGLATYTISVVAETGYVARTP